MSVVQFEPHHRRQEDSRWRRTHQVPDLSDHFPGATQRGRSAAARRSPSGVVTERRRATPRTDCTKARASELGERDNARRATARTDGAKALAGELGACANPGRPRAGRRVHRRGCGADIDALRRLRAPSGCIGDSRCHAARSTTVERSETEYQVGECRGSAAWNQRLAGRVDLVE
jgi:hypothetical protein